MMIFNLQNHKNNIIKYYEKIDFEWEANEEFELLKITNNWNDNNIYLNIYAIYYYLTPFHFKLFSINYIDLYINSKIVNDRLTDAIILTISNDSEKINEFSKSELIVLYNWIGVIISKDEFLISFDESKISYLFNSIIKKIRYSN
jgi:hypothetical protein